ncbi:MAG TPA: response regulator [Magnetospirillaceae bacterium]
MSSENSDDTLAPPPATPTTTVMLVEPDVLARMVIAEYLRGCGYTIVEGVSADDVFAVVDSGRKIDIVFSEVTLIGEVDGFALSKQIRATHPNIDVILTQGVTSAAERAGRLCEDGPLDGPYHPQEVARRINLLRERRRTSKKV